MLLARPPPPQLHLPQLPLQQEPVAQQRPVAQQGPSKKVKLADAGVKDTLSPEQLWAALRLEDRELLLQATRTLLTRKERWATDKLGKKMKKECAAFLPAIPANVEKKAKAALVSSRFLSDALEISLCYLVCSLTLLALLTALLTGAILHALLFWQVGDGSGARRYAGDPWHRSSEAEQGGVGAGHAGDRRSQAEGCQR